jgi:hypothetical protein
MWGARDLRGVFALERFVWIRHWLFSKMKKAARWGGFRGCD